MYGGTWLNVKQKHVQKRKWKKRTLNSVLHVKTNVVKFPRDEATWITLHFPF